IDRALGWRNTLTSALELSSTNGRHDAFADWTIREAEALAPTAQLHLVTPIKPDWKWGAWPALAAGALAIGLFVPARHRDTSAPEKHFDPARQQEAAAQIRDIQKAIAPAPD